VVNESFAERFFQGENVIGKRIRAGDRNVGRSEWPWVTIVGVVPDMYSGQFLNEDPQGFYRPLAQGPRDFFNIVLRTRGEPIAFAPMLRGEVFAMDPHLPIYWVWSMAQDFRDRTVNWVIWGTLFMVFGFVALFLAAIGLYGVMAFSVSMRTREIGLRVALGATTESVLKLVLKQGMTQLALGITIGLGIAAGLSRLIGSLLRAVDPWDPAVFVVIVLTLGLVGLLACLVPARRAARVDPMSALKHD
jgi:putative ABC transport system permease protein